MTPALAPTTQNIATKIRYEKCGKDCKILSKGFNNLSAILNLAPSIPNKIPIARLLRTIALKALFRETRKVFFLFLALATSINALS